MDLITMETLRLPAPAKLNLFLHIIGQRTDGYHDIQTAFQFLDFHDVLTFEKRHDSEITLDAEMENAPADNLITRAALKLQQKTAYKLGANIQLKKHLPVGGGVGGGSSDAATTLLGLNELWETKLSLKELAELGAELGADVPVFVYGHAAWAEGVGDQLTPIILPEPWYLLIIPPCQTQTARLYQDPRLMRDREKMSLSSYHPGDGHNDFEPIARLDYPEIARALDWLEQYSPARLSGSGATVFAAFDTREEASRIGGYVANGNKAIVAQGLNQSPLHRALFGH
jgi:4-diphosphocytidyl-2-C-methyl-D-erythritol kinase